MSDNDKLKYYFNKKDESDERVYVKGEHISGVIDQDEKYAQLKLDPDFIGTIGKKKRQSQGYYFGF